MNCPFCGHENIAGVDCCERCEEPLGFMSKPRAKSPVEKSLLSDQLRSIVSGPPITVRPDTPVRAVLQLLIDHKIGCVVVTHRGAVQGMFSERDALQRLDHENLADDERPVSELMTASPETLEDDAEIAFALHKMDVGGYRHLPVTRGGRVVGVVSIRDILRYVSSRLAEVS